jgi:DNA-binding MurR/RpiR family transcriptional regulator
MDSHKSDLLEKIVKAYPLLSPKKRRVADLIMKDYKKVFFMTAREVAQECDVSEPTIVRFACDLGYSGYAELIDYMKGIIHSELTSVERLKGSKHRFGEGSTLERYCRSAIQNLENLMNTFSIDAMKQVAETLYSAHTVFVAGYRASATLANHFGYLLKKIRKNVFLDMTLGWELIDSLNTAHEEAVLFAIAFPRYPRRTIEVIEYAKKSNVKVIGFTDNMLSPVARAADQSLIVDIEGVSFVDPFAHIITFLGALVHEICIYDDEKAVKGLSNFDNGVKAANEFYMEEDSHKNLEYQLKGEVITSLWPQKRSTEKN